MALQRDGAHRVVSTQLLLQVGRRAERTLFVYTDNQKLLSSSRTRARLTLVGFCTIRCGNVAAILELDEHLQREFIIFEAAPQETRGIPSKKPVPDYFL